MHAAVPAVLALVVVSAGCVSSAECGEANPTPPEAHVLFWGQATPDDVRAALQDAGYVLHGQVGSTFDAALTLEEGGSLAVLVTLEEAAPSGATRLAFTLHAFERGARLTVVSPEAARDALRPHMGPLVAGFEALLGEPLETTYEGGKRDCGGPLLG